MVGHQILASRNGPASCFSQPSWRASGHEDSSDMTDIELDKPSGGLNRCHKCSAKLQGEGKVCRECSTKLSRSIARKRPPDESESEDEDVSDVSDTDSSEELDSSADEETMKENRSDSVKSRKRSKRPPHFIRVNQRPMIEMESGSNVWYQARILKERPTQLLITFPGVTEEEDDTREWLEKTNVRIWYGDYKMRSWKYLGKGSWAPKKNNKRKPPHMPKVIPVLVETQEDVQDKQQQQHQHRRDQSSVATTSWSDRVDDSAAGHDVDHGRHDKMLSDAEHSATHSGCRHDPSVEDIVGNHPGPRHTVADEQATEVVSMVMESSDPLQQWFLLHFSKLGGSAFVASHPAYSTTLDTAALQICPVQHQTQPVQPEPADPAIVKDLHPNCSPTGVLSGLTSHPSDLRPSTQLPARGATSGDDRNGACISSPIKPNLAQRSSGITRSSPEHTLRRVRSASDERVRAERREKKKKMRASSQGAREGGRHPNSQDCPPVEGGWRPPKELCGLLDGMFEVQHPRQRSHKPVPTSASDLSPCSNECADVARPSAVEAPESRATFVQNIECPRPHKQRADRAHRDPGTSAPKSHRRHRSPPCPSRPRGRVLMSDSEDDSEDDMPRKPARSPTKLSRKHAQIACHTAAKKASHAPPPGLKNRSNPRNFFTM